MVYQTDSSEGRRKNLIVPTPEFMGSKTMVDAAELFSPIAYPMLIEPNDWSETGVRVFLNEIARSRHGEARVRMYRTPYHLNKIQKVGYRSTVHEVAETFEERLGRTLSSSLLSRSLSKACDIATNKEASKIDAELRSNES